MGVQSALSSGLDVDVQRLAYFCFLWTHRYWRDWL